MPIERFCNKAHHSEHKQAPRSLMTGLLVV